MAPQRVTDMLISPGGTWLALLGIACNPCGGDADLVLEVLDAVTGATDVRRRSYGWWPDIAFSPDGRTLAFISMNELLLLDADTGAEVANYALGNIDWRDDTLAFTPDGSGVYLVWGNALRQLTLATGIWADVPGVPLPYTGLLPAPDGGRWAILQHDAVLVDCACRALLIGTWSPSRPWPLCQPAPAWRAWPSARTASKWPGPMPLMWSPS